MSERRSSDGTVSNLNEANEIIRILRDELAAICVAVGRSKDDGFDVDWYGLHKDVAALKRVHSSVAAPSRNEIIEECARVCDRAEGECENLLHEQPWSDYARACRNEAQSLAIGIRALKT